MTQLVYSANGTGSPVLLLHGFMGRGAEMQPLADALRKRVGGIRTVVADLPGHGESPAPDDLACYPLETTADALAATLAAASQHPSTSQPPAHLVGYSMGGRAALCFAIRHPHLVASLTLIGASPGISNPAERAKRRAADDALANRAERQPMVVFAHLWAQLPMWRSLERHLGAPEWERRTHLRSRNNPVGITNSLRAAGTGAMTPLWDELGGITAPTLLLAGEADTKFVETAQAMAERLADGHFVAVPEAGHAAHLEAPGFVADAAARHITAAMATTPSSTESTPTASTVR